MFHCVDCQKELSQDHNVFCAWCGQAICEKCGIDSDDGELSCSKCSEALGEV
jgi:hypothetical protein